MKPQNNTGSPARRLGRESAAPALSFPRRAARHQGRCATVQAATDKSLELRHAEGGPLGVPRRLSRGDRRFETREDHQAGVIDAEQVCALERFA